mgnify:CR=1 FL=1
MIPVHKIMLLLSLIAVSCTPRKDLSYEEARKRNIAEFEEQLTAREALGVLQATDYNLLQRSLTATATADGYSYQLVQAAEELNGLHQEYTEELNSFARKHQVVLPDRMSLDHQQMVSRLDGLQQLAFDETFMDLMQEALAKDIENNLDLIKQTTNQKLEALLNKKLELAQNNLKRVKALRNEIVNINTPEPAQ